MRREKGPVFGPLAPFVGSRVAHVTACSKFSTGRTKKEFIPKLQESIQYFYKYYQELNKDKIKHDN